MTTTSFTMNRRPIASFILVAFCAIALLSSCKKDKDDKNHPSSYSSEVVDKWMTLQLRLMRNATGIPNQGFSRHYAYAGVAAIESLAPGMNGHQKWSGHWNGLTGLPSFHHSTKFYYPANVNAALASINKAMFPNASENDKAAIDSLESALYTGFLQHQRQPVLEASSAFGKAVAAAVFSWAESDGYKNANAPYTVPTGPGLWVPTAPAFAPPATPYWGANRTVIDGSTNDTQLPPPPAYSTAPGSPFYQMVKQVYDASQVLTTDQKAAAIFWRDVPGATSPGHWLSIVQQVIRQTEAKLDKAVLAYALTGAAMNDALIACFKTKYQYNLVRPITYIRDVMGHTTWAPYIGTPAHPEYSSAHSSLSAASGAVMEKLFGNIGTFTDHTYDYLNLPARSYASFMAIAEDAGQSRLYGGIHYQLSIDAGLAQGKKVAANLFNKFRSY